MSDSTNPFSQDVIDAVRDHMNLDHEGDSLLIVQSLGGRPAASAATMSDMNGDVIEFEVTVDGEKQLVQVPWSQQLTERAQVRVEVTRMYHEACERLGIAPREAAEH